MVYVDKGWIIHEDIVIPPQDLDPKMAYKFILEAVYDNHIPVTRVVAYSMKTGAVRQNRSLFDRDVYSVDDRLTVAYNLTTLLPLTQIAPAAQIKEFNGELLLDNLQMEYSRKPIQVLGTQKYILTVSQAIGLEVIFRKSTGYRDVGSNFDYLETRGVKGNRYFPCYSYHSLIDYVKVMPFDGQIKLRFLNGMTSDIFVTYLKELFTGKPSEWKMKYSEVFKHD